MRDAVSDATFPSLASDLFFMTDCPSNRAPSDTASFAVQISPNTFALSFSSTVSAASMFPSILPPHDHHAGLHVPTDPSGLANDDPVGPYIPLYGPVDPHRPLNHQLPRNRGIGPDDRLEFGGRLSEHDHLPARYLDGFTCPPSFQIS